MTKPRIKFKSKFGGKKIDRLAELHGAYAVLVGVLRGTGAHPKGTGQTIAEIAWWNEFGTRKGIPERPFLRWTFREHNYYRKHMEQALFKAMTSLARVSTAPERFLKIVGAQAAKDIREMITKGDFKPLKKATIRRKSTSSGEKDRPLIDTGILRRSITYQLVSEFGSRMLGG